MARPIKVAWLGLRGFPGVQGGVETHAEQLCPRLVEHGLEVSAITRRGYQRREVGPSWRGVRFVEIWTPRRKQLEAIVHTFLGVLHAGLVKRPDVLHIQAIGPALMTPLARLLGLRVVVTHHGPDYDRQKWGRFARWMLRLGESLAARWASELIVISKVIHDSIAAQHGRDCTLIRNGLSLPATLEFGSETPRQFGLEPGRYVLLVSRLVPEKRHLDLIEAFRVAALDGWKLAIVGAADHADPYAQGVVEAAARTEGVVATGFQSGTALQELYANAGLFVLPSSHEGLPIAILEALSYGLPVVASDIPANLEIGLPTDCYAPLGDVAALAQRLREHARPLDATAREAQRRWAAEQFSWERSALQTQQVYERVARSRG